MSKSFNVLQRIKLGYFKRWVCNPIVGGDRSKPAFNVFIYESDDQYAPYLRLTGQTHNGFSAERIEQGKPETPAHITFEEVVKCKFHVVRAEKHWVAHNGTLSGDIHNYWSIPQYIVDYHLRWDWIKPIVMKPISWVHSLRPYPKVNAQTVINFAIARRITGSHVDQRSFSSLELSYALCPWQHHKRKDGEALRFTCLVELILHGLVADGILAENSQRYSLKRLPLHYSPYAAVAMPSPWSGDKALQTGRTQEDNSNHLVSDRTSSRAPTVNVNLLPYVGFGTAVILLLIPIVNWLLRT